MKRKIKRTPQNARWMFAAGIIMLATVCIVWGQYKKMEARTVYREGFYYEKIPASLKKIMRGVSYKKNKEISWKDLRHVVVKHYNFAGKVKTGELVVHKKIAKDVVEIFYELYQKKYPIKSIALIDTYDGDDEKSMEANNTSAFNFRYVTGSTTRVSKHGLGLAIDINPRINPYVKGSTVLPVNGKAYKNRNKKTCKGKHADDMIGADDEIVALFKAHGFSWGGDWNSIKDYQHFEHK